MNWISTVQRVREELHRFGSADVDTVSRGICRAIRHYNAFDFFFNRATYDITLTAGQVAYGEESAPGVADGYPADFMKPLSLIIVDNAYTYPPMKPMDLNSFRRIQEDSTSRGYPSVYTSLADDLLLDPSPNDAYILRVDYIAELGTPTATYTTAWAYTVGGVAIADTYSNAWFTHAQDLIVERAKTIILGTNFKDLEAAQASRIMENECLNNLVVKNEKAHYPHHAEPWV